MKLGRHLMSRSDHLVLLSDVIPLRTRLLLEIRLVME